MDRTSEWERSEKGWSVKVGDQDGWTSYDDVPVDVRKEEPGLVGQDNRALTPSSGL